ncbi:19402_t:CDS:1, partial [Racocetra persica]
TSLLGLSAIGFYLVQIGLLRDCYMPLFCCLFNPLTLCQLEFIISGGVVVI